MSKMCGGAGGFGDGGGKRSVSSQGICYIILCIYYTPSPPHINGVGGVYWNHFVYVSDHVCSVFPDTLNHFLLNLVWWCIIMRQYVFQKKNGSLSSISKLQQGLI